MLNENNRIAPRKRTLLPAKIYFNNKQSVLDCILKNFSSAGALLKFVSTMGVPDNFLLVIPSAGKQFHCCVVWSNAKEVGVSFDPLNQPQGKPDLRLV